MLLLSEVHTIIDRKNAEGRNSPFNITFLSASDGSKIEAENVVLISTQKLHNTLNLKWPSGEIRTIHKPAILKINDHEIIY